MVTLYWTVMKRTATFEVTSNISPRRNTIATQDTISA
uniref:Uncharacterized protein n=1 Tax=Anguilla anguilla TaxID=7936 RepID=A0A0E9QYS7_ANGAN